MIPPSSPSLSILVVDDEPMIVKTFTRVLRGHDVDVAKSIAEARPLTKVNRYDMVVVDRRLGDGDGSTILDGCRCAVRVVMSGAPPDAALARRVESGELLWLDKPFELGELESLVAKLLA